MGKSWRRWTSKRRVRVGGRRDRAWAADRAMVAGQAWDAGRVVEEQVGDGDGAAVATVAEPVVAVAGAAECDANVPVQVRNSIPS